MTGPAVADAFAASRTSFEELLAWLHGSDAAELSHSELEDQLDTRGRELLRQLYQGQLDLRTLAEQRVTVIDTEGVRHGSVESGHVRPLGTVFGTVQVTRLAYRHRGHANVYRVMRC